MGKKILGSDFAKLGTGSEEEMALVKVNPENQHWHSCYGSLILFVCTAG